LGGGEEFGGPFPDLLPSLLLLFRPHFLTGDLNNLSDMDEEGIDMAVTRDMLAAVRCVGWGLWLIWVLWGGACIAVHACLYPLKRASFNPAHILWNGEEGFEQGISTLSLECLNSEPVHSASLSP
jgi:hypothetical protein